MYTDLDKKRNREKIYGKIYRERKAAELKEKQLFNRARISAAILVYEMSLDQEKNG